MVNQLEITNRVVEHKRRPPADQLAQSRLPTATPVKPAPTRSIVIAQDLFRLLRERTLRA